MTRLVIFCEGLTEETFCRDILYEYFSPKEIWLTTINLRGIPSEYEVFKRIIMRKCLEESNSWVTTMVDFYGLPTSYGKPSKGNQQEKAKKLIDQFSTDINHRRFIANVVLHEFEALLFSKPDAFLSARFDNSTVEKLTGIRNQFESPELINDSIVNAPSKRIKAVCLNYDKVFQGTIIAKEIGLQTIRRECPLFDSWISKLEGLSQNLGD